jgi:hypothetical protein
VTPTVIRPHVDSELEQLRRDVHRCIAPALRAVGVEDHEVVVRLEGSRHHARVVLSGPPTLDGVRQALGVRVLDAVHAQDRTYGPVEIVFHV